MRNYINASSPLPGSGKQKAENRKQKAESTKQKAESRRQKAASFRPSPRVLVPPVRWVTHGPAKGGGGRTNWACTVGSATGAALQCHRMPCQRGFTEAACEGSVESLCLDSRMILYYSMPCQSEVLQECCFRRRLYSPWNLKLLQKLTQCAGRSAMRLALRQGGTECSARQRSPETSDSRIALRELELRETMQWLP